MTDSPRGQGQTPPQRLNGVSSEPPPKKCRTMGEDASYTATWGATNWRHKTLCRSALIHSTAPVGRQL
eukprot:15430727-Alexandrium_andersonii.AAC.1